MHHIFIIYWGGMLSSQMCEVRSPDMFTDSSSEPNEDGSSDMLSEDDQEQMEVVHR